MKNKIVILAIILISSLALFGCKSYSDEQSGSAKGATENTKTDIEVSNKLADGENFKGNKDAQVIIVELADFECPACRSVYPEIKKFNDEYKDKVKFVFLNFPLSYHKNAMPAALAALAAGKQGKYWEMYDTLFTSKDLSENTIKDAANNLGLDMNKFDTDRNSDELKNKIAADQKKGNDVGLTGTPTLFINGVQFEQNPSSANLKSAVDALIK